MQALDQIKMLNLTEEDFKLLVDGLESLPERGLAGEMMGDLIGSMLADKNPEAQEKIKRDREMKARKQESEKQLLKENIRILQGKLLMLKRSLQENKLLSDTYEIINK